MGNTYGNIDEITGGGLRTRSVIWLANADTSHAGFIRDLPPLSCLSLRHSQSLARGGLLRTERVMGHGASRFRLMTLMLGVRCEGYLK